MTAQEEFLAKKEQKEMTTLFIDLKKNAADPNAIFNFFEGKDDDDLYPIYIRLRYHGRKIFSNKLKGKKNVLDFYYFLIGNNFFTTYGYKKFLFFVDKDFDCILKITHSDLKENIFITDLYAIENYLTLDKSIDNILENLFDIKIPIIRTEIIEEYHTLRLKFSDPLLRITALFIAQRQRDITVEGNAGFKLKKLNMDMFFTIKNCVVTPKLPILDIDQTTFSLPQEYIELFNAYSGDIENVPIQTIKDIYQEIKTYPENRHIIRGKFDLWFFINFLNYLKNKKNKMIEQRIKEYCVQNSIDSNKEQIPTKVKVGYIYEVDTIFNLICPHITIDSLDIFLSQQLN